MFSEVLTREEWLKVFDNVFSNHPSYLLMLVAAYTICSRAPLLHCNQKEDFEVNISLFKSVVFCILRACSVLPSESKLCNIFSCITQPHHRFYSGQHLISLVVNYGFDLSSFIFCSVYIVSFLEGRKVVKNLLNVGIVVKEPVWCSG